MARNLSAQGFLLAGEAAAPDEAVSQAALTDPDVALVDLRMSTASGIDVLRALRSAAPTLPVVAVAPSNDRSGVDAVLAGASAYVLAEDPTTTLVDAISMAPRSDHMLVPRALIVELAERRTADRDDRAAGAAALLSERELQVLRLLVDGEDNHSIGGRLFISPHTVKAHVSRILDKLGVSNRVQAAVEALRMELV